MKRLTTAVTALLDLLLVVPTHLLCWAFSWGGVMDGDSDRGRPAFPKLVIAVFAAIEACSLLLRCLFPPRSGPTAVDLGIIACLVCAAYGRRMLSQWLARAEFKASASANATANATASVKADVHGDIAEAVKAFRETLPNNRKDDERGEYTEREAVATADPVAAHGILGFASAPVPTDAAVDLNAAPQGATLGNWNRVRGERQGVMLHFDDSTSDSGSITWLTRDPACKVSYNTVVLDSGKVVQITPMEARAWHAGVCDPSNPDQLDYDDANSAFYGLAVACGEHDHATDAQVRAVARVCLALYRRHGWDTQTELWRITTHAKEAYPRGRKIDCEGTNKGYLVLDPAEVRRLVQEMGRAKAA